MAERQQTVEPSVAELLNAARRGFDQVRGDLVGVLEVVEALDELVTGDQFGPVIGRG